MEHKDKIKNLPNHGICPICKGIKEHCYNCNSPFIRNKDYKLIGIVPLSYRDKKPCVHRYRKIDCSNKDFMGALECIYCYEVLILIRIDLIDIEDNDLLWII